MFSEKINCFHYLYWMNCKQNMPLFCYTCLLVYLTSVWFIWPLSGLKIQANISESVLICDEVELLCTESVQSFRILRLETFSGNFDQNRSPPPPPPPPPPPFSPLFLWVCANSFTMAWEQLINVKLEQVERERECVCVRERERYRLWYIISAVPYCSNPCSTALCVRFFVILIIIPVHTTTPFNLSAANVNLLHLRREIGQNKWHQLGSACHVLFIIM